MNAVRGQKPEQDMGDSSKKYLVIATGFRTIRLKKWDAVAMKLVIRTRQSCVRRSRYGSLSGQFAPVTHVLTIFAPKNERIEK